MEQPKAYIIMIAYYFPPDSGIGGIRPFRFYKYLRTLGYECIVITASAQSAAAPGDIIVVRRNRQDLDFDEKAETVRICALRTARPAIWNSGLHRRHVGQRCYHYLSRSDPSPPNRQPGRRLHDLSTAGDFTGRFDNRGAKSCRLDL